MIPSRRLAAALRPVAGLGLSAILGLAAACGEDATFPQASYVLVSPGDTVLAPGDSVWLSATSFTASDAPILGMPFTWSSSNAGAVLVDAQGVARAVGPGDAVVAARDAHQVRGAAVLRVRQVASFAPEHGAFGEIIRLRGAGFTPDTRIRFGQADAFIRSVAADGRSLDAWVPVGARPATLWITGAGGADVATERTFYVTGAGDDALEPNGIDLPLPLPIPFHNPSLVARPMFASLDPDVYTFTLGQPGPVHVELIDRSGTVDRYRTMRAEIWDVLNDDVVVLTSSFSYLKQQPIGPLHVSFPRLDAGTYRMMITPFAFVPGFSNIAAGDRSYGLRLDAAPVYGLPPDAYEPNSYPRHAAQLPFPADITATIEFPWGADYFVFDLPTAQPVWLRLSTGTPLGVNDLDLFLMNAPGKSIPWIGVTGQYPPIYFVAAGDGSLEQIVRNLPAGRYVVGVLDGGGVPASYRLQIQRWTGGMEVPPEARATASSPPALPDKMAPWAASASPAPED